MKFLFGLGLFLFLVAFIFLILGANLSSWYHIGTCIALIASIIVVLYSLIVDKDKINSDDFSSDDLSSSSSD